jgi:hypothetical protein
MVLKPEMRVWQIFITYRFILSTLNNHSKQKASKLRYDCLFQVYGQSNVENEIFEVGLVDVSFS